MPPPFRKKAEPRPAANDHMKVPLDLDSSMGSVDNFDAGFRESVVYTIPRATLPSGAGLPSFGPPEESLGGSIGLNNWNSDHRRRIASDSSWLSGDPGLRKVTSHRLRTSTMLTDHERFFQEDGPPGLPNLGPDRLRRSTMLADRERVFQKDGPQSVIEVVQPPQLLRQASDPTASDLATSKGRLLFYDFNWRRLIPGRATRASSSTDGVGPLPAGSGHNRGGQRQRLGTDPAAPGGDDFGSRKALWARSGMAMHFITLEFQDSEMEAEFVNDWMRRNRKWVTTWVLVMSLGLLVSAVSRTLGHKEDPPEILWMYYIRAAEYFLQWLLIKANKAFWGRRFQLIQFFWCIVQATTALIFVCHVIPQAWAACADHNPPRCGKSDTKPNTLRELIVETKAQEDMLTLVFTTMIFFRIRFVYFFTFVVYITAGYLAFKAYGEYGHHIPMRYFYVMGFLAIVVSWTYDWLSRKDFVQASVVWKESRRSDMLLHNILPGVVVDELKASRGQPISKSFASVTILFADVVSFTTMSAQVSPQALVELLNDMFNKIDDLAELNGVEKIKTIGDCYMAAAGLPLANPKHAQTVARFALGMLKLIASGCLRNPATGQPIQVRVGMHTGPCVAGVIGHKKFAYDIWGDAVNTAARMESHGEPMRLHCSSDTHELLRADFQCEARAPMEVKGKGTMQTYFVLSERTEAKAKSFLAASWKPGGMVDVASEDEQSEEDDDVDEGVEATMVETFVTAVDQVTRRSSRSVSTIARGISRRVSIAAEEPEFVTPRDRASDYQLSPR